MEYKTVRYANVITRAASNLSVLQQRIIYSAISKIKPTQKITGNDIFTVTFQELIELSQRSGHSTYENYKASLVSLVKKTIILSEADREGELVWIFPWLQWACYDSRKRRIAVRFSDAAIPFVSSLRSGFTVFKLEEITGFTSAFTQPIYTRLMRYMRDLDTFEIRDSWFENIDWKDLRHITIDPEKIKSYEAYSKFKERVLDVAINEINNSPFTTFFVRYHIHKRDGKKAKTLRFDMFRKEQTVEKRYVLSYEDAVLSEKQLVMVADWLSGNNKTYAIRRNVNIFKFYEIMKAQYMRDKVISFKDTLAYRDFLIEKLAVPDFVREFYDPWLKQLGFAHS